jgi:hypothetical protein
MKDKKKDKKCCTSWSGRNPCATRHPEHHDTSDGLVIIKHHILNLRLEETESYGVSPADVYATRVSKKFPKSTLIEVRKLYISYIIIKSIEETLGGL